MIPPTIISLTVRSPSNYWSDISLMIISPLLLLISPSYPQDHSLHPYIIILVGGLEHEFYDFPSIGNFIIPTDFQSIIFQDGVGSTSTTKQLSSSSTLQGKFFDLGGSQTTNLHLCQAFSQN